MSKTQRALERAQREQREYKNKIARENEAKGSTEKITEVQTIEKEPLLSPWITYHTSKIAMVDRDTLRHNRLVSHFDGNLISDQYKIIKTKILQKTQKEGLNTILITSAFAGEGKSVTSANVAISLAKEMIHTVLLVDADLRKPSLHKLFGLQSEAGLSDYLLEGPSLQDLFINPGIDRLLLLPGHLYIDNSTEAVGTPKMERLVSELKSRYPERYIIFDSPPLIEGADSLILSKYVDGVILVIEAGKTQIQHIKRALSLLEGKNLIGLVLNKGEIPESKKYYYSYLKP